jgi:hypothetical protein
MNLIAEVQFRELKKDSKLSEKEHQISKHQNAIGDI